MTVKRDEVGTTDHRMFVLALRAGAALDTGSNRPRGANAVNAYPTANPDGKAECQLSDEWAASVRRASLIIYFYATPVAWVIQGGTGWVVPADTYSATTTGAQNRIRAALREAGTPFRETADH